MIIFLCECKKDHTQNNTQNNAHWTKLFVNSYNLESICFPDADTGYVVGWTSYLGYPWVTADLFKTINGGTSWTALTLPNPTGIGLNSVYFTDGNTGYAVGSLPDSLTSDGVIMIMNLFLQQSSEDILLTSLIG